MTRRQTIKEVANEVMADQEKRSVTEVPLGYSSRHLANIVNEKTSLHVSSSHVATAMKLSSEFEKYDDRGRACWIRKRDLNE